MSATIVTLRQVLGNALDGVEVLDYGSAKDFKKLWEFDGLSDRILIVWGRTAPDGALWPIDASACLSPLDWAAAYARHCCAKPLKQEEGHETTAVRHWPQVMILDATPESHLAVPTLSHYRTLRPDQLPWLTVPESPGLKDLCCWLRAAPEPVDSATQKSLGRLLREIRLNLTEVRSEGDYDRHSVSNIVAPMVFLGRTVTESPHADALLRLLRACGLCAEAPITEKNGTDSPEVGPAPGSLGTELETNASALTEEEGSDLSILLVDDQEHHGWSEWLRHCFPKAEIESMASPFALVEAVEKQLKESKAKDLRFRFQLPRFKKTAKPVLFLDLRLFSGNPEAEKAFFRSRLLPLIDLFFLDRKDLAWPSFSSKDPKFTSARKIIEKDDPGGWESESPAHHEALTWLPRILALADMSLPIVVFSSTGLRNIIAPLASYRSIVSFAGKNVADASQVPSTIDARADLRSVVSRIRVHLLDRESFAKLQMSSENLPASATRNESPAGEQEKEAHAVVYLDETGSSPNLTFGALVVVYDTKEAESQVDTLLSGQFANNVRAHNGKEWLKRECGNILQAFKNSLTIEPRFLKLRGSPDVFFQTDLEASDELHDENVGDNLWRSMLKQTIEASIFVIARKMAGNRVLKTFSVRAPSRALPVKTDLRFAIWERWGISTERVGPDAKLVDAIEELGLRLDPQGGNLPRDWPNFIHLPRLLDRARPNKPPEERARYFNFDGVRPMVEEIMKLYRSSTTRPTANVVRGFGVNAHASSQGKKIPIAHFLVDALLAHTNENIVQSIEIIDTYGRDLEQALETNRCVVSNRIEDALVSQISHLGASPACQIAELILKDLCEATSQSLTGDSLLRFSEMRDSRNNFLVSQGRIFNGTASIQRDRNGRTTTCVINDHNETFIVKTDGTNLNDGDQVQFQLQRDSSPGKSPVAIILKKE